MKKNEKKDSVRGTSPAGIAVWPKLDRPDTKFDADGVFSTGLRMSAKDAAPMMKMIDKMMDDMTASVAAEQRGRAPKRGDPPYRPFREEDGSESGDIVFNFKMKAVSRYKDRVDNRAPAIFDAAGKPMVLNGPVGGGSKMRVAYSASAYFVPAIGVGVSLRLEAVQILELVKRFDRNDAATYGFETVETQVSEDSFPADDQVDF